jgi:hypothetical protein
MEDFHAAIREIMEPLRRAAETERIHAYYKRRMRARGVVLYPPRPDMFEFFHKMCTAAEGMRFAD